jgi:3-(3-hydroxy-phenyl)propionate hydroxylase
VVNAAVTARPPAIVVGAGPVGLIAALGLARQGIPVIVLEAEAELTRDLRAGTFHPPTLEMMAPLGITEPLLALGIRVPHWQIRDRRAGTVVQFDLGLLADDTPYPFRLHCEQHKLTPIARDLLAQLPGTEIRFGCRFVAATQSAAGVTVTVATRDGTAEIAGSYLIGADGGRSAVRKALDIEFEGFTWPERFLVVSTRYDLAPHGFTENAYVADPDEWVALFKMPDDGPPGLWRLAFPTDTALSEEAVLSDDFVEARMQGFLARPARYAIAYKGLYRVHQRVARTFRAGRCLLAGDAAHVNNPLGAMGLNSGIHDAVNLSAKLGALWRGERDDAALDHYDRQRRRIAIDTVQAITIRNKRLLEERDAAVRAARLDELRRTAADPRLAYEFLLKSSMIASVRQAAAIA